MSVVSGLVDVGNVYANITARRKVIKSWSDLCGDLI